MVSTEPLTPAEAVGWQIIDTLDEETRAKLFELIEQADPEP